MKLFSMLLKPAFLAVLLISFTGCEKEELNEQLFEANASVKVKAPAEEETVGNNLSFPVIWAEDIPKTLRDRPTLEWPVGQVLLEGEWWYVWGPEPIDPKSIIYSCEPSPTGDLLCADDKTVPGTDVYKGWVQKDPGNFWEAYNANAEGLVEVDFIDWGDNLESIDWRINSKVRTELVLYENVIDQGETVPVLHYPMRHVDGWGITEVHGLQTDLDNEIQFANAPGDQATVYSEHTRMTIQKLNVAREDLKDGDLEWNSVTAQWEGEGIINEPIFSKALSEAGDGPEFFNAEVNVKGKIIYGYTWDMKAMNDGTGDYRITYSFDETAPNSTGLNTSIRTADIIVAIEEEVTIAGEGESGGDGVIDADNNLTYMDIRIVGKTTGGAGGNSGGNGGGNSGGSGNSGGGGGNSGGGGNGGGPK